MNLTNKNLKKLLQESDRKKHELIERCRNGDRQAFNQFIQNEQDDIFSHVQQMVGSVKETSQITQEVFVTAYKLFPKFHNDMSVEAWLFKIAERHIQSALRTRKKWYAKILPTHTLAQQQEAEEPDKLLIAYMDGELSDLETKCVEERLEEDADYRQEYEKLQQTDNVLRFFSQTSAPANLRVQINAKLDEKSFREKVHDAIAIFRETPPGRRLISPTPLPTRGTEETEQTSQTLEDTQELTPLEALRRQAEARYDKADFYKKHGKLDKAIHLFEEALAFYQKIKQTEGQIVVHHQLALLYKDTGKNDKALQHAQEFLEIYQNLEIVKKHGQIQELLKELHFPS
jgi:DNA-directed RNA polymerase specialized sigma24 family protein